MDYSAFRNSSALGEAVSVNHKALITRALTKYPVDYALFRELLQNSADAQADSATIQFETSLPKFKGAQLHSAPITRLRFSNDGLEFAKEDWNRLREIASGNPNEAKIGAFGVGFYSVFELTDEPLVHSGHSIMNFKYQGVQLRYYFTNNMSAFQKGTLIDLPYKTVGELPDLVKFIGFLVQSFLLVNLNRINLEVKFGDNETINLLTLTKVIRPPSQLRTPPGLQTSSPNRTLKMKRLQKSDMEVVLKYLNITQMPPLTLSKGFFSFGKQLVSALVTESADPEGYTEIKCELIKVDCFADVSVSSAFRKQMVDTLLKPPPNQAILSLISFSKSASDAATNQLKSYVLPEDFNDAKIFIGFPTKQSTGLRSHLALNQLIPTMERTAVDMSNKFVKDWNSEMLYMGGIMARCTYEYELSQVQKNGVSTEVSAQANEIWSRFKFGTSAPDKVIGLYIKAGFWKSSNQTLVPSSKGVLTNSEVRLPRGTSKFLRITPVVANDELSEQLESLRMIQNISNAEIVKDIESSPLHAEQALEFIKWLVAAWDSLEDLDKVKFVSALQVFDGDHVYDFNDIRFYLDRSHLPDEEVAMHLPPSCLPSDLGNTLGHSRLKTLGVRPLDVISWTNYRLKTVNAPKKLGVDVESRSLANTLQVASRTWNRLSSKSRNILKEVLTTHKCMPTQNGLQYPYDAYVKEIKLFPQLPVVLTSANLPDSWLLEIGVRASMDMAFVLEALSGSKLKWTNEDLLQYLEENFHSLTRDDWAILQDGNFFARRGSSALSRARDLYPPDPRLERLGIPTIALGNWNENSNQARVLRMIGIQKYPSVNVLFASLSTPYKYDLAIEYFLDNYDKGQYSSKQLENYSVIPIEGDSYYVKPSECFYDDSVGIFGLRVMKQKLRPNAIKLGVRESPPVTELLGLILRNPGKYLSSPGRYEQIMTYFAKHAGELSDEDIRRCKKSKFIPLRNGTETEWYSPGSVYLPYSGSDAKEEDLLRPLLKTITPSRQSLPFFQILGITDRPNLNQLLKKILSQPATVFNLCSSVEVYEAILYQIDAKWPALVKTGDLLEKMKSSPFLIGKKRRSSAEKLEEFEISLYRADQLVIVDDVVIFNQFKDIIITCPQDDNLERLYSRLGVPKLSEILKESVSLGNTVVDEPQRLYLENRVNERLQLHKENTSKAMKPLKHIKVELVSHIELQRQLPPHASLKVKTSACMHPISPNILLVSPSPGYDWIDIANALAKSVLLKPDQDSVVVLEVQLSSDLNTLEKKGYSVQRIRKNDAQHKEKISKLLIDERSEKQESALLQHNSPQPQTRQPRPSIEPKISIPGQFPHEKAAPPSYAGTPPFPKGSSPVITPPVAPSPVLPSTASKPLAPPQSMEVPKLPDGSNSGSSGKFGSFPSFRSFKNTLLGPPKPTKPPQNSPGDVTSALNEGLSSAREFSSSSLNTQIHVDPPQTIKPPVCSDPNSAKQLKYLFSLQNGVKVYTKSGSNNPVQDEELLSRTILTLCDTFGYSPKAISIFREANSNTLAFNHNGSIFFNSCVPPAVSNPLDYYYPIMAHELAHNLVSDHGAAHSFYTESYVQHTLPEFTRRRQ